VSRGDDTAAAARDEASIDRGRPKPPAREGESEEEDECHENGLKNQERPAPHTSRRVVQDPESRDEQEPAGQGEDRDASAHALDAITTGMSARITRYIGRMSK
jgi:hypothetical protein